MESKKITLLVISLIGALIVGFLIVSFIKYQNREEGTTFAPAKPLGKAFEISGTSITLVDSSKNTTINNSVDKTKVCHTAGEKKTYQKVELDIKSTDGKAHKINDITLYHGSTKPYALFAGVNNECIQLPDGQKAYNSNFEINEGKVVLYFEIPEGAFNTTLKLKVDNTTGYWDAD